MIVTLTHNLKVRLLEAIRQGEIDTDIFNEQKEGVMSLNEVKEEIVRLELLEYSKDDMLRLSDLMQRYASGSISREEYINERLNLE